MQYGAYASANSLGRQVTGRPVMATATGRPEMPGRGSHRDRGSATRFPPAMFAERMTG